MEKLLLKTASILYSLHGKFPKLKFLLDWSCRVLPYHTQPEEELVEGVSKITIQIKTILISIEGVEHYVTLTSDGKWENDFLKENTNLLPHNFLLKIEERNYIIGIKPNGTYYCNASNFGGPVDGIPRLFMEKD